MIVKDDSTGLSTDVHPNDLRDGVCLEIKLSADSVPSMLKEENLEMNLEGKDEATSSNRVGPGEDSQNDQLKKDGVRAMKGTMGRGYLPKLAKESYMKYDKA
ncbi:hypothetical protein BVRB_2g038090 [Beta vulgaris subsp. vulgaris]|uniref:uncharacterized protein LOC109134483 n=1 Tax=Beta vulgaris subsp. vulgaris TaxID=3555 RepID=UPI00065C6568|nr:uncharacterized protein LOC109134483 [Beta vulgaris subsp. vulgaris]KMT17351.1 hypothetical protein BVRB_2g038090 [Beta vulgaris subsp. vulgaris]